MYLLCVVFALWPRFTIDDRAVFSWQDVHEYRSFYFSINHTALLSMEGQRAIWFHLQYLILILKMNKGLSELKPFEDATHFHSRLVTYWRLINFHQLVTLQVLLRHHFNDVQGPLMLLVILIMSLLNGLRVFVKH